jgi:hypothetical protein
LFLFMVMFGQEAQCMLICYLRFRCYVYRSLGGAILAVSTREYYR